MIGGSNYGFLQFSSPRYCAKVQSLLDGFDFGDGRTLHIKAVCPTQRRRSFFDERVTCAVTCRFKVRSASIVEKRGIKRDTAQSRDRARTESVLDWTTTRMHRSKRMQHSNSKSNRLNKRLRLFEGGLYQRDISDTSVCDSHIPTVEPSASQMANLAMASKVERSNTRLAFEKRDYKILVHTRTRTQ